MTDPTPEVAELVVALQAVAPPAEVRDILARLYGDPSVELLYPSQGHYVDADGKPVDLPEPGPRRNVTVLRRQDREIAALVCDPTVCQDPDLPRAFGAAATLTLENERLQVDLRAQLEQLAHREARLDALVGALPDLLFRFDRDGTYLEARAPHHNDLLYPPTGALEGHNVREILPADVAERFLALVGEVLAGDGMRVLEYDLEYPLGLRAFEARIVPSGSDEVLAIVRDMTERKQAEAELLRLHAELRQRLDELQASRARLVQASDDERHRLERDIHDGAQQRLLAARLALRLTAGRLAAGDAAAAAEALAETDRELEEAVEELRAVAHGIRPAVLTDEGLRPALHALARRVPIRVDLSRVPAERLPSPVEAALYFTASEALTNVMKHARATRVSIDVERRATELAMTIADDGAGGADPARGSGLHGLQDRVEALGGRLTITPRRGGGTCVTAVVPCA